MYKTLRIACRHSKFLLFWKYIQQKLQVLNLMGRIRSVHFPLKLTAKTGNFKEKAASKKKDATKSVKTLQINIFLIKALKRKANQQKEAKS